MTKAPLPAVWANLFTVTNYTSGVTRIVFSDQIESGAEATEYDHTALMMTTADAHALADLINKLAPRPPSATESEKKAPPG